MHHYYTTRSESLNKHRIQETFLEWLFCAWYCTFFLCHSSSKLQLKIELVKYIFNNGQFCHIKKCTQNILQWYFEQCKVKIYILWTRRTWKFITDSSVLTLAQISLIILLSEHRLSYCKSGGLWWEKRGEEFMLMLWKVWDHICPCLVTWGDEEKDTF